MEVLGVGDLAEVVYLWKPGIVFLDLENFWRYSINEIGCKTPAEDLLRGRSMKGLLGIENL